jgi:hypothetical protein
VTGPAVEPEPREPSTIGEARQREELLAAKLETTRQHRQALENAAAEHDAKEAAWERAMHERTAAFVLEANALMEREVKLPGDWIQLADDIQAIRFRFIDRAVLASETVAITGKDRITRTRCERAANEHLSGRLMPLLGLLMRRMR